MATDISHEEEMYFDGNIIIGDREISVTNVKIIRKKYLYLDDITFQANFSKNDRVTISDLTDTSGGTFVLKGLLRNKLVVTAEAYWNTLNENEISGIVTELRITSEVLVDTPKRQFIYANLSDTCLALPEVNYLAYHFNGEIKEFGDSKEKKKGFTFSTELGLATLVRHYSFEDDDSDDTDVVIRISRVTLNIEVEGKFLSFNQGLLFDKFKKILKPIESVISFLSRRQVRWYELILTSEEAGEGSKVWESRELRKGFSTIKPDVTLVNPYCLKMSDSLDAILKSYINSPYCESIGHSINYLNARWKDNTIETKASNSFTAFETIVNGISEYHGDQEIIKGNHFKKLRSKIEKVIKEYCIENNYEREIRSDLYKKVSELKRAPVVSRAIILLEKNEIYHLDIIRGEESLKCFLQDAYGTRSLFLHTGKIEDFSKFLYQADRIHALTERLIYKIIGGKKEWLDPFAYRYVLRDKK